MAPRAARPLPLKAYYLVKALVYGPAAYMPYTLYGHDTGIIFAAAVILNEVALSKHNASRLKS